ncbi:hypothetical protein NK214_15935 [Chromobacterium sp. S0633]|uniref:hypothetical protein n=1 Tax=Chromobacterium sp. S0633 TaxID=2957805 RepID=UPI00209F0AE5|nr:hypothetical protein [Chromobacterium sp. S0633]MCP1291684.1 hypothetical protein [Chromobacterium sp. S0633]
MRKWIALWLGCLPAWAATPLPPKPALPPEVVATLRRDGAELLRLPMCVDAKGAFSGQREVGDALLSIGGTVSVARAQHKPLLNANASWSDQDGKRVVSAQTLIGAQPELVGSWPQRATPYGQSSGVVSQQSSLSLYLQISPRAETCGKPKGEQIAH